MQFFTSAVRNGTEGPDLSMVGGLWAQYQSALAMSNPMKLEAGVGLLGGVIGCNNGSAAMSASPARTELPLNSPNLENPDESSSSGQKEDDEGSEDDSDDRMDTNTPHDPERLKAFNVSEQHFWCTLFYTNIQFYQIIADVCSPLCR